jgi:hypothetical protein
MTDKKIKALKTALDIISNRKDELTTMVFGSGLAAHHQPLTPADWLEYQDLDVAYRHLREMLNELESGEKNET